MPAVMLRAVPAMDDGSSVAGHGLVFGKHEVANIVEVQLVHIMSSDLLLVDDLGARGPDTEPGRLSDGPDQHQVWQERAKLTGLDRGAWRRQTITPLAASAGIELPQRFVADIQRGRINARHDAGDYGVRP
jgi:hypothetical protein